MPELVQTRTFTGLLHFGRFQAAQRGGPCGWRGAASAAGFSNLELVAGDEKNGIKDGWCGDIAGGGIRRFTRAEREGFADRRGGAGIT